MRDMSPPPLLRIGGFVALAGALWLITSLFNPPEDRLAAIVLDGQVDRLFKGEGALPDKLELAQPPTVAPGAEALCASAVAKLARRLTVEPAATATLEVSCRLEGGIASLEASLVLPDAHPTAHAHARALAHALAPALALAHAHALAYALAHTHAHAHALTLALVVERSHPLPRSTSLLPPLLGILFALIFRQVLLALFTAVVLGALLATEGALGAAALKTVDDYAFRVVADEWNLYIFGFTILLVGMVHIAIRMGGMRGIVDALSRIARSRRSAQAAAGAMGCAVFFDDYANTVVVGSSVRTLTDQHRISREKLAYIVDSTAAPIAGLAVISTWIGFEITLFNEQVDNLAGVANTGYELFFQILPYRFYCIFALALVFLVALTGRDYGPMLRAERRALHRGLLRRTETEHVEAVKEARSRRETTMKPGAPPRWYNGVIPIVIVIIGAFAGAILSGVGRLDASTPGWSEDLGLFATVREAFIAAGDDTMTVLFWASAGGAVVAFALATAQRILTPAESGRAFFDGMWMIAPVIAILILAIALRKVTDDLGTPIFLVALVGDVPLWVLPITVFGLAAVTAFATGTSWGTMGILIPVALPLVAALADGQPGGELVILLAAAAVLDGAIFGDHGSLISDTTIMSSLASGCDHVDHVRTQLPYAMLAMIVAGSLGYTLLAWGGLEVPVWLVYVAGVAAMWAWLRFRGADPSVPT